LFLAVGFLRQIRAFPERGLVLAFLSGRFEASNVALTSAEGEKRGLDAPHSVLYSVQASSPSELETAFISANCRFQVAAAELF
jgi:hypothetical protein